MTAFIVTQEAKQDLIDTWLYIAEDNSKSADNFLSRLSKAVHSLESNPYLGRQRAEIKKGLYCLAYRNYLIFYRAQKKNRIFRVIHSSRDIISI